LISVSPILQSDEAATKGSGRCHYSLTQPLVLPERDLLIRTAAYIVRSSLPDCRSIKTLLRLETGFLNLIL
jgi:hypothetical protein